jgi:hypothetical protein
MTEVKKTDEGENNYGRDLLPFQEVLEFTNGEVNQLLEEIKHMRNGGAADTSFEKVEDIKKRIFVFPKQIKEKIVSLEKDDIEKLKIVLQKMAKSFQGINPLLIVNNIDLLKVSVQEWLALIRDGIIIVGMKEFTKDEINLVMLADLSSNIKEASLPGQFEIWVQENVCKWFGRQRNSNKLREMFDIRKHAERMVKKYKKGD